MTKLRSLLFSVLTYLILSSLWATTAANLRAETICAGESCLGYDIDDACCDCRDSSWLERHGISISGLLWQSVNTNSRNPQNTPPPGAGNFPAGGWIYRGDEYMLNRLELFLSKPTNTEDCDWDIGGNIDLLYGTDYILLQSRGLETHGDFTGKWNSDNGVGLFGGGLQGLALPEAYLEVAYRNAQVKLGHFYHPLGFERYDPNANLIGNTLTYSGTFSQFAPVTGMQVDVQMNERLALTGGFHRGDANWEDNNDRLNGYGMVSWTSCDAMTELRYTFDIGAEDDAGVQDQYIHSIVWQQRFCEKWIYAINHQFGHVSGGAPGGGDATWYSFVNHLAYEVNDKLIVGMRYEWFDDVDGTRVFPAPGAGVWNEIDFGGTYRLTETIWLRPELRWDWFDADAGVASGPFKNGTRRSQFMASLSLFVFI